jgi:hypothetical protein
MSLGKDALVAAEDRHRRHHEDQIQAKHQDTSFAKRMPVSVPIQSSVISHHHASPPEKPGIVPPIKAIERLSVEPATAGGSPAVAQAPLQEAETLCKKSTPRIILYNRIPKCASGSMNIFIEEAKTRQNFTICRSSIYTVRHLNPDNQRRYAMDPFKMSNCRNRPKPHQRGIMSRHIFYLNFKNFGLAQPAYMNIIRHPVERCVSRFYYERDARGTVPSDMTLDKCMKNKLCDFTKWNSQRSVAKGSGSRMAQMTEECSSNYLTRWFCGMDRVCGTNTRDVLEMAKTNMREEFAFVGLTSEMKMSFAILQKILPDFFGAKDMPMDICNKCKNQTNRDGATTVKPALVNDENRALIAEVNSMDMELYEYAVHLFWKKARACGFAVRNAM